MDAWIEKKKIIISYHHKVKVEKHNNMCLHICARKVYCIIVCSIGIFFPLTFRHYESVRSTANHISVRGEGPVVGHARWYPAISGLPQRVGARSSASWRLRYYSAGPRLVSNTLLLTVSVAMRPRAPLGQRATGTAGHVTVLPGQRFLLTQRTAERRFDHFTVISPHARHVPGGHAVPARGSLHA